MKLLRTGQHLIKPTSCSLLNIKAPSEKLLSQQSDWMESHVCDTQKLVWFDTVCFTSVSPLWGAVSRDVLTCTEGSDLPSGIHCSWTEEVQSSFELSPLIFLNTLAVWSESFILQTYNETGFLASYLRRSCRPSHSAPVDWKGKWTTGLNRIDEGPFLRKTHEQPCHTVPWERGAH